jgi:hypothetical protein
MINLTKKNIQTNWRKPLITPKTKIHSSLFYKQTTITQISETYGIEFLNLYKNKNSKSLKPNDFRLKTLHLVVLKNSGSLIYRFDELNQTILSIAINIFYCPKLFWVFVDAKNRYTVSAAKKPSLLKLLKSFINQKSA